MKVSISIGSDVLYHITGLAAAENILRVDRFELKPSEGTAWEQQQGSGKYYLSTARSRVSAYIRKSAYRYSVLFELDGRKLGTRYKVKAVDYWETNKASGPDKIQLRLNSNEMEDRVLSDKAFINKASSYITAVHACKNDKTGVMFSLKKMCLIKKIPIFFYENAKDLITLDTRKAIHVEVKPGQESVDEDTRKYRALRQVRAFRSSGLRRWVELYKVPITSSVDEAVNKLNDEHGKRAYTILRYDDAVNQLNADMHNAKSARYGDGTKEREYLDFLVREMRAKNQAPAEFLRALRQKWYGYK